MLLSFQPPNQTGPKTPNSARLQDDEMENLLGNISSILRKCLFSVLSFGPMPNHVAFIMDGNRRFAKNHNALDSGHAAGFSALVSILQHCYEMGVGYVTVYAFSIDNFKRDPEEVGSVMDLMREKIDELLSEGSVVSRHGIRINFWGNLDLLSEGVRLAAERAMSSTEGNTGPVLSVCMAYTSSHEILNAVQESASKKRFGEDEILVCDLERHLYSGGCPDPDILIRTSGETRLSNFLLWQTASCHLQSPRVLWPEFSLRHLVWAVLEYQVVWRYLEERSRSRKSFSVVENSKL